MAKKPSAPIMPPFQKGKPMAKPAPAGKGYAAPPFKKKGK